MTVDATSYTPAQYTAVADAASSYRCITGILLVCAVSLAFVVFYQIRLMVARHKALVGQVDGVVNFLAPMGFVVPVASGSASGGTDEDSDLLVTAEDLDSGSGHKNSADAVVSEANQLVDSPHSVLVRDLDVGGSGDSSSERNAFGGVPETEARDDSSLPPSLMFDQPESYTLFISKRGAMGDGWLI